MDRKKLYVVGAVVGAVLLIFIITIASKGSKTPAGVLTGNAKLTGTVSCLPKKGNGPQTTDCAYGLKTSDGKYYAVRTKDKEGKPKDGGLQSFPTGVTLTISGKLSSSTSQTLDVDGVLDITEIKE